MTITDNNLELEEVMIDLKPVMKQKNITPYRLSKITGIKSDTIYRYYNNKVYRIDLYNLVQICKVLDCKIEDIIKYGGKHNI